MEISCMIKPAPAASITLPVTITVMARAALASMVLADSSMPPI